MVEQDQTTKKQEEVSKYRFPLPQKWLGLLADEIAGLVAFRIAHLLPTRKKKKGSDRLKTVEKALFLDTSAIIDGRIFDVVKLGLLTDTFAMPSDILWELKHIADSQDAVRHERGRKGLEMLEGLKKMKNVKVVIVPTEDDANPSAGSGHRKQEVDDILIATAKKYKGRILTCDYNLEKKASIQGVVAININNLAHVLKVTAVPGEAIHMKILHVGKDITQGVGYLDDGTMVVVEQGAGEVEKEVNVVVSRVIQTASGRILFAKKI